MVEPISLQVADMDVQGGNTRIPGFIDNLCRLYEKHVLFHS